MGAEDLDQAFILGAALRQRRQVVAAGSEGTSGGVAQRPDRGKRLGVYVYQVLGQGADDAVAGGKDAGNMATVAACRLEQAAGRGVDGGGDTAGLGVECVAGGHVQKLGF